MTFKHINLDGANDLSGVCIGLLAQYPLRVSEVPYPQVCASKHCWECEFFKGDLPAPRAFADRPSDCR